MLYPHEATTFAARVEEELNRVDAERRSNRHVDPPAIIRSMQADTVKRSRYTLPELPPDPVDQL